MTCFLPHHDIYEYEIQRHFDVCIFTWVTLEFLFRFTVRTWLKSTFLCFCTNATMRKVYSKRAILNYLTYHTAIVVRLKWLIKIRDFKIFVCFIFITTIMCSLLKFDNDSTVRMWRKYVKLLMPYSFWIKGLQRCAKGDTRKHVMFFLLYIRHNYKYKTIQTCIGKKMEILCKADVKIKFTFCVWPGSCQNILQHENHFCLYLIPVDVQVQKCQD